MALRNIIKIDEDLCDGCGHCVEACAEGAIEIIDGVAKLVGEIYCDGFGACLGHCPQDALTIEQREAVEYDEQAVEQLLESKKKHPEMTHPEPKTQPMPIHQGCPGSALRTFGQQNQTAEFDSSHNLPLQSQLGHWPVQMMLVSPMAPFLKNADLLICADCVPFAVPDFHSRYLKGRAVLVGCPKLDDLQHYLEKMKDIFKTAQPRKITVLKMEVPCCTGIAKAAIMARDEVAPQLDIDVHTIRISGGIVVEDTRMIA